MEKDKRVWLINMPVIKALAILTGSLLFSIGINAFLIPHELLDGGVIGLGLILHYLLEVRPGLMMILISIPIYLYAWFRYRSFFYNSLHGLLISSWMVDILSFLRDIGKLPIVPSAILGGDSCWVWHRFDASL